MLEESDLKAVKSAVVYGGTPMSTDKDMLKAGWQWVEA